MFEIYRINYCFLVLSKTGIFFLQPWRSRRNNIVWRGHILLSFSNGKRQSGHTFGRNNTVKPRFKDTFFRKFAWRECLASNRRERFCSCSPAWPRWTQSKTSNYIKREFQIKQWVISDIWYFKYKLQPSISTSQKLAFFPSAMIFII